MAALGNWDLSSLTKDGTVPSAVEAQSQPLDCEGGPKLSF